MLYKSNLLTLETIVYSWCILMSIMYRPKWTFLLMLSLMMLMIGTGGSWVELPVQERLCPIFVSLVGLPDIHEFHWVNG